MKVQELEVAIERIIPVATLVTVTMAPATTWSLGSRTVPLIAPVPSWLWAGPSMQKEKKMKRKTNSVLGLFMAPSIQKCVFLKEGATLHLFSL